MERTLKALTIWQPHATLLAIGAREIETRSWGPGGYRGPLLIHAASRWDLTIADTCGQAQRLMRRHDFVAKTDRQNDLANTSYRDTLGMALAVCRIKAVLPCEESRKPRWGVYDQTFGGFGRGRCGWLLEDVVALPLGIRLTGKQSWWDVLPADVERIADALGDAADRFWPAPALAGAQQP